MTTKCKFQLTIILTMLFCRFSIIIGQAEITWKLQPLKFDVDKIELNRYGWENNHYIVHQNNVQGVINEHGKLILPIEYTRVEIWEGANFFSGVKDNKQVALDKNLKVYTWDEAQKLNAEVKANYKKREREKFIIDKGLENSMEVVDHKKCILISNKGITIDTIRSLMNFYQVNKDLIKVNKSLFDLESGIHYDKKEIGDLKEASDKYLILAKDRKSLGLFNYNLDTLIKPCHENLYFTKDDKRFIVSVDEDTKITKIYDNDLNLIKEGNGLGYVYSRPDFLFYNTGEFIEFYEIQDKNFRSIPYSNFRIQNNSNNLVINVEGLKGVYNLNENKLVITPKHQYIKDNGDFLIGYNKGREAKPYTIYNRNGDLLGEYVGTGFDCHGKYLIIYNTENLIIDNSGQVLLKKANARFIQSGYLSIIEDNKSYLTPIENYLGLNTPEKHFDLILKEKIKSIDNKYYLIAKRGDKYGVINNKGEIILKFDFDNIDGKSQRGYLLLAQWKGKHGILDISSI